MIVGAKRQIQRCPHCDLNQYVTEDETCRRCRKSMIKKAEVKAPVPFVVPVIKVPRSYPRDYASAFRLMRLATGISQREAGKRMGAPRTYISKVENSVACPLISQMEKIARVYDFTMEEFVNIANCLGQYPEIGSNNPRKEEYENENVAT